MIAEPSIFAIARDARGPRETGELVGSSGEEFRDAAADKQLLTCWKMEASGSRAPRHPCPPSARGNTACKAPATGAPMKASRMRRCELGPQKRGVEFGERIAIRVRGVEGADVGADQRLRLHRDQRPTQGHQETDGGGEL